MTEESGQIQDKVNDALDQIENAVGEIRQTIEAGPIRDLASDMKGAVETFISTVEDAIAKARDVLEREDEGETPDAEGGSPPHPDQTLPGDLPGQS
jgi:hypothetical protein